MPVQHLDLCVLLVFASIQACFAPAAFAWTSPAADVVLYCAPALQAPLHHLADDFTGASGIPVHVFVAPPDGLIGLIRHRARADVVVADAGTIGTLAAGGAVRAGSVVGLGRDALVLIARADAPLPQDAGVSQLLGNHVVVLPDPTTAASFDGASVLRQVSDAPAQQIGVSDTPTVLAVVRENGRVLGLVYQTEVPPAWARVAATLPAAPTQMAGALVTLGQSGNAGRLLAYIAGKQGEAVLRQAGLEPLS
jgi:ABC-type molybdate transport system substrate-binding protein